MAGVVVAPGRWDGADSDVCPRPGTADAKAKCKMGLPQDQGVWKGSGGERPSLSLGAHLCIFPACERVRDRWGTHGCVGDGL